MQNSFTVTPRKPRNPLVPACLMRLAGRHQRSAGAHRQRAGQALRKELARLPDGP
ncbi:MAG: hypothetical protein Q8N44_20860 [Rubrivivax sp.]|nr:hypothetical protein [Rubrivivax sp.]